MIPIGLIILTVIIINFFLILADIYLYKKFKKLAVDRFLVKLYFWSIPIFAIWLIINSIVRWSTPVPSKFAIFSNYFLTFWYLPKFLIFLVVVIISIIRKVFKRKEASIDNKFSAPVDSGRRKVISALVWSAVGLPYFTLARETFKTTLNPKVFFVEIPIANLPPAFKNLNFVQISDIHSGSHPSKTFFANVVEIINALHPDLVFITGDFVNFSPKEIEVISESLSNIKAKYGVLACPGNHEHYMKQTEFELLVRLIRECNVDLLINENRIFNINGTKLQIAGVDNTSHRMNYADFDKALFGLDLDLPVILLCHDPTNWDKHIRRRRKVDLTLAGHTHGGQIAIDIFKSKISPAAFFYKQYAGLYSDGNQHLYVNTGIGWVGVPVRAGLPPEITQFRLVEVEKFAEQNIIVR
jgi:predicted MPP superfamily phosphohydrolase